MTGELEPVSDLPGVRSKLIHGRRETHVCLGVGLDGDGARPQVGGRILGDGSGHPGGDAIVGSRKGVPSEMMVKRDPLNPSGVNSFCTDICLARSEGDTAAERVLSNGAPTSTVSLTANENHRSYSMYVAA